MSYTIEKLSRSWGTSYHLKIHQDRTLAVLSFDHDLNGNPQPVTINWSAIGACPPEEAEAFAAGLLELVKISRMDEGDRP